MNAKKALELLIALLLAPLAPLNAQQPADALVAEFAALPTDIGAKFLRASLGTASLKVLAMPTPQDPTQKYTAAGGPKNDTADLSRLLMLKATTGPVSREEIQALETYLLAYPLPRANIQNYHFRRFYVPAMLEWVFERRRIRRWWSAPSAWLTARRRIAMTTLARRTLRARGRFPCGRITAPTGSRMANSSSEPASRILPLFHGFRCPHDSSPGTRNCGTRRSMA